MFHSLRAACVAAVLLCTLPAGMWGQRVCLSGCDDGNKVVQRFDPVAAQRMFDEAFETIDSLTVAGDSLQFLVDSMGLEMDSMRTEIDTLIIDRDTLMIRLARSILLIDTLIIQTDSLWTLVDTLYAEIDSLQLQLASVSTSGGTTGSTTSSGCGSTPTSFSCGQPITHHGVAYSTVQIGTQCWFAENLKALYFCDGTPIPNDLVDGHNNSSAARGVWFPDSATTFATKGVPYNWYAATDSRGVCPSGWHVPSETEWQTLVDHLGGWSVAGGEIKSPSPVWNGNTPGSGFNALQTGSWEYNTFANSGSYANITNYAWWWTSTSISATDANFRLVQTSFAEVLQSQTRPKSQGNAIRCLKD